MSIGKDFLRYCLGAVAFILLQMAIPAVAHESAAHAAADDALARWKGAGHPRPIVESHIHFWQVTRPGDVVFPTPTDLASYKAHFDVLMTAFGPDRLIWGSNWPVITLHGTFEAQIAIAEEYLAPFGTAVRDKVMARNALLFYRRHVPGRHDD